jgi:hypothetical protein
MKSVWMSLAVLLGLMETVWGQVSFSPEMLILSLQKGQNHTAEIEVTNNQDTAKDVTFKLEYRKPGPLTETLANWCSVEPAKIRLEPKAHQRIIVILKCGSDAQGECVLSLFAGEKVNAPISLNVRMGMPIIIRFNNERRASGEITSVESKLMPDGLLVVNVQVINQGVLHLAPFGLAWVNDSQGKRVWQMDIRSEQPVFPKDILSMSAHGSAPIFPGVGELHVRIFWDTLYGNQAVGVPKSSEKMVPFNAARMN